MDLIEADGFSNNVDHDQTARSALFTQNLSEYLEFLQYHKFELFDEMK